MDYPDETKQTNALKMRLYEEYVSTHTHESQSASLDSVHYAITSFLPDDRRARVLDLGCGSGSFLLALSEFGFNDVEGVDLSAEQIALAHSRGLLSANLGNALTFLRDRPNTFDVITANDFIEHLDKSELLDLTCLVEGSLRAGGIFLAQLPNGASPFFGGYFFGDLTHQVALTQSSVRQLCEFAGFGQVDVIAVPPRARGLKGMARRIVWTVLTFPVKVALAAESGRMRGHIVTSNLAFRACKKV